MYGMLLESVQHFIQEEHGEEAWTTVLEHVGLRNVVFSTHRRYCNDVFVKLAKACSEVLKDKEKLSTEEGLKQKHSQDDYMEFFGRYFVKYFSHYGYDMIMRVSGRHYRDFLHGIDNLHETMRFSYPKMLSPSFYVEDESATGCKLHYCSKRIGFKHYVIGQLKQMGTKFYDVEVEVKIERETVSAQGCHVIYELRFPNTGFIEKSASRKCSFYNSASHSHISGAIFFRVSIFFGGGVLLVCVCHCFSVLSAFFHHTL